MIRKNTYFISDIHLGARYIQDAKAHERIIVNWLKSIKHSAKAVYLLGDILDYWYEYRNVVPRGFVRFFGTLAELADDGVEIVWFKGNHDTWIFDYLPSELGIEIVDGSTTRMIDGRCFFMEHGDGVGRMEPGYTMMRSMFRSKICQKMFSAIHPRWTVGFAHSWSSHSRLSAPPSRTTPIIMDAADPLLEFAIDYSRLHPEIDYYIFGHRHQLSFQNVPGSKARIVLLGDAFRTFSFGVWDGSNFELKELNTGNPIDLTLINQ